MHGLQHDLFRFREGKEAWYPIYLFSQTGHPDRPIDYALHNKHEAYALGKAGLLGCAPHF